MSCEWPGELSEAIKAMRGQPLHWTIVGSGEPWLLDELKQLPHTRVTGPVSRAEVAQFYQEADVFILPTHSDGYALTQLEAAAYGLPVIASRHCGDVVEPGVTGLLLDDVSASEIQRSVMMFVDNPDKVQRFRRSTLERKYFTSGDLGNELLALTRV